MASLISGMMELQRIIIPFTETIFSMSDQEFSITMRLKKKLGVLFLALYRDANTKISNIIQPL